MQQACKQKINESDDLKLHENPVRAGRDKTCRRFKGRSESQRKKGRVLQGQRGR